MLFQVCEYMITVAIYIDHTALFIICIYFIYYYCYYYPFCVCLWVGVYVGVCVCVCVWVCVCLFNIMCLSCSISFISICANKEMYNTSRLQNSNNDNMCLCDLRCKNQTIELLFKTRTCFYLSNYLQDCKYLTLERPEGYICPVFYSGIYYINITKNHILISRQIFYR